VVIGDILVNNDSLASVLLDLGLRKQDRVMIVSENSHEVVEFTFAVAKTALIGVIINYRLTSEQIASIFNDCKPKVIITQDKHLEKVKQAVLNAPGGRIIVVGEEGEYESLLAKYSEPNEPGVEVNEDDMYLIEYTTGTTGLPKGVVLTHKNRMADILRRVFNVPVSVEDVYFCGIPVFGIGGLGHLQYSCFTAATTVVCPFSGKNFAEMVQREKVTIAGLNPTLFKTVQDYIESSTQSYDLSSLRKLPISGGQHTSAAMLKEILDYFNIPYSASSKTYGMSEATSATYLLPAEVAAGLRPDATEKEKERLNSDGKPLFNTQLRVVDENDEDVAAGQRGRVLLKGDVVMAGYWNNPELTREVLQGGWYHSSDMGILDQDGYFYFAGRANYMIKSGALFVSPEEVENAIIKHRAVAEAAVIGVPDKKGGEIVMAIVSLKEGLSVGEEEIKEHCTSTWKDK